MRNILIIRMTNQEIADNYLQWFSKHYDELKYKFFNFCREKHLDWNEDIFSDTYLKVYDTITKNGMKDTSEYGMSAYTFMSFRNNIKLEKVYSRNKKRDRNINSDNINEVYEAWYNENYDSSKIKLLNDLYVDFATLYIMTKVEENFDAEHFYLYRMKTLIPNMTFKKLQETTNIKSSRKKVLDVMHYVKTNITKEEIRKLFFKLYGDLLDE